MRVVIASDADGMSMKESIKEMLIADGHEVVDYSETPAADFVDSATAVAKGAKEGVEGVGTLLKWAPYVVGGIAVLGLTTLVITVARR